MVNGYNWETFNHKVFVFIVIFKYCEFLNFR